MTLLNVNMAELKPLILQKSNVAVAAAVMF